MRAKVMFILADKSVWFCGNGKAVPGPVDGVRWFTDVDEMLEAVRDIIVFNVSGVTQIRIIGDDF